MKKDVFPDQKVTDAFIDDTFNAIDVNGDKKLSKEEMY